ncbi:MAG: hypothetical protein QXN26_05620 [Thermoplasmataceae archaeon]
MLARPFMKSLLSNRALWGWGIGFMAFWLFMGAYVFGFRSTSRSDVLGDTSLWFSLIGLIAGSIVATTVSYSVYYANASLAYSFRYTRLKPYSYIADLMISTSITGAIVGAFIVVFTAVIFSSKAGYMVTPALPVEAIAIFFLMGLFMFLLSVDLVVFMNNYAGLKNISFVVFIPQILSYIFGFSELGVPLPSYVVYASPFSDIPRLLFQTYFGSPSFLNIQTGTGGSMNPYLLLSGLLSWIVILFILALILVRRIKPRSIEEGRQI